MQPRMLVTFDEDLNPLSVPVRVGLVSVLYIYIYTHIYILSFHGSTLFCNCSSRIIFKLKFVCFFDYFILFTGC